MSVHGAKRHLLLFDLDGVLITRAPTGELIRTPGSWEALSALQYRTDAVSTLATAAGAAEARAKVGEVTGAGLARYLDLEVGGYGDVQAGTPGPVGTSALLNAARAKAREKYGVDFRVLAVTAGLPAEVAAAREQADLVVAVGTDARELREAGAGVVVGSLTELVPLVLGAVAANQEES